MQAVKNTGTPRARRGKSCHPTPAQDITPMTNTARRLDFGMFLAPFHRLGENPTLSMERNMRLIEHLDTLGFDQVWIGEHHSFARELIADPVVFLAAAAARTRHIRLGTGVTSLPYHHPFMVADRMLQVDHMTRGRAMLGCGPGALVSDAYMMGIDPKDQRRRMNESLGAIMRLLRGETVSMQTDWFTLREARLQMANFTVPHLPVSVATSFTPSGAMAAGEHGTGLLSVAGADHEAFERTWGWVEEAAAKSGRSVDRSQWMVVVPMHLAHSRKEALEDIREGYARRAYSGDRLNMQVPEAPSVLGLPGGSLEAQVDRGAIIAGTPDDAIAQIRVILERSGGIGGVLVLAHEWASTAKTMESYELLARYVVPVFKGQMETLTANRDWIETNGASVFGGMVGAMAKAFTDAGKDVPEALRRK
jgi:limonene 1,2-monooxygenase